MLWFKKLLIKTFLSDFLGSLVRHLLTALGGILMADSIANETQVESLTNAILGILPGLGVYVFGQVASFLAKRHDCSAEGAEMKVCPVPPVRPVRPERPVPPKPELPEID